MVIVHLVEFRIAPGREAEVVGCLRHPELRAGPRPEGLIADIVGRRLGQRQREHVLVTSWKDEKHWRKGTDKGSPRCLAQVADLLIDRRDFLFRVVGCAGSSFEAGKILRVYRGSVALASLPAWEARACEPIQSLSAKPGLVSLAVGPCFDENGTADGQVLAVSSWRDWDAVLDATGGHLDRLLEATEMTELERPLDVQHYQLLDGGSPD